MTARQIISQVFKGQGNILTPETVETGFCGTDDKYAYEISTGEFLNNIIFGVTIVDVKLMESVGLGKACNSLEEAQEYIKTIV